MPRAKKNNWTLYNEQYTMHNSSTAIVSNRSIGSVKEKNERIRISFI